MAIMVTYGGDPIPKSPFMITVAPPLDLGKVKVQGLNESKHFNSTVKLNYQPYMHTAPMLTKLLFVLQKWKLERTRSLLLARKGQVDRVR